MKELTLATPLITIDMLILLLKIPNLSMLVLVEHSNIQLLLLLFTLKNLVRLDSK
jgi:hypothetical protein